jgi:hypothetical protein
MGRLDKHVSRAGAIYAILLLAAGPGCETTSSPPPRAAAPNRGEVGPPPSSDVTRLAAWRDAEKLAEEGSGRSPAAGRGQSMAPLYGDNTMLIISKVDFAALAPGMIVAYVNRRGFQVVHRLVEQNRRGEWVVQGFNNERIDADTVTPFNLVGVVYASLVHDLPED